MILTKRLDLIPATLGLTQAALDGTESLSAGLRAAVGVLRKCGFRFIGDGGEPGVIRFELMREEYRP